jgi:hypothetical protein
MDRKAKLVRSALLPKFLEVRCGRLYGGAEAQALQSLIRRLVGRSSGLAALALAMTAATACRVDMHVQPKYNPLEASSFFADGRSERPEVPGTVAHGNLRTDELRYTGKINGVVENEFPFPITRDDLERGRQRFNVNCSPCHDYTGSGHGMIVQRGFQAPPSYHIERLRNAPVGHFFDVITNGYGAMYSYANRVAPDDRWRIAAYIRALQLSQHAALDDVPADQRGQLTEKGQ